MTKKINHLPPEEEWPTVGEVIRKTADRIDALSIEGYDKHRNLITHFEGFLIRLQQLPLDETLPPAY